MSIAPRDFYRLTFNATRIITIIFLVCLLGIIGHLLTLAAVQQGTAQEGLVAILVLTALTLVWALASWCGYTRHYFSYLVIYAADLFFLAPFTSIAVLLRNPLSSTACASLSADSNLPTTPPPRAFAPSPGTLELPAKSSLVCHRLVAAWGVTIVVCVLLASPWSVLSVFILKADG